MKVLTFVQTFYYLRHNKNQKEIFKKKLKC